MPATDIAGQVAIVTGGSRGYGEGIAQRLREAGAEVWITARDGDALRETAGRVDCRPFVADVTSGEDWDALFGEVMGERGRLDILINNAGAGIHIAPLDEQADDEIAASISINLVGPLLGCRRAAPVMKAQGSGSIINVSSVCALYAWPGYGPYSAAKAGLNQFGHCLHVELRESGVRVTTITPSWGATGFADAAGIEQSPINRERVRRRVMQPLEMGDLVLQILSMPAHLAIPDITTLPLIQEIMPF
jgi:NAD(P)-dependent dehydrogenase (short-subunit alcohol dehydrogenase family)